jgi:amino acid adenylation domain-containing protein
MSIVSDLVAEVAYAAPDAIAIETDSILLTYRELQASADTFAVQLKSRGVGPDSVIGVCLPRSCAQIAACLAVMRSGAAYLPLDPAWPKGRLHAVLRDAGASTVVTTAALVDELSVDGCTAMVFDGGAPAIGEASPPQAPAEISPENLAYVIYTSGSTGQPKGVELTHGNLSNLVSWHRQSFALAATDRVSHCASLSFDAAVWEIWATLTAGATLVLPNDEDVRMSPALLRDWIVDRKITIAFVPTVLAESLMKADWPAGTGLRLLLTGAETLHSFPKPDLPFSVINNYGPTECAVVATSGVVPAEKNRATALPTIGRPISNVQIHILNEAGAPVAEGESGELYIGGAGVARGYRNRPELTAKRFLPDPFSATPMARMYRTGDLGRILPDGQIVFEGRVDNQEKVRGYRVEPDEIASNLNRHPAVASSIVIADGERGERRLVAYFVGAGEDPISARDLRDFLSESLPNHMIPSMFIKLEALPQTGQGKLDRGALPKPTAETALSDLDYRKPTNPTERRVAAIVASVLCTMEVGVDDNFFLLGGHSLLGTQVVVQLRQAFGIELTLRHLFKTPTVASLAETVEKLVVQKVQSMTDEEARSQAEQISLMG